MGFLLKICYISQNYLFTDTECCAIMREKKGEDMTNLSLLLFGTTEIVLVSVFGAIILALTIYACFVPLKSWFTALFSGVYIPSWTMISFKNKRLDIDKIIDALSISKKSKLGISLQDIVNIFISGGDGLEVIRAIKLATDAKIYLDLQLASAIELSSHRVVEIVNESINSQLIEVADIKAFTQDKIEIIASANVSIKLNLSKYLSGLGLDDLKSNIKAWILENIAKTNDHKTILKEPNQALLSNLDLRVITKNSMFNVIDINISSISLGRDLNAEKEMQAVEKEKIYAQIEAERRRNAEEIKELQMRTKTEEMKSSVLQAEAEVPMAISQAIKEGRFSVMDYYKLMNLQADTALRRSIINESKNKSTQDDGDDY